MIRSADFPGRYARMEVAEIGRSPLHAHDRFLEIVLVLDGSLRVKRSNAVFGLAAGEWAFVNRGEVHCLWSETGAALALVAQLDAVELEKLYPGFDRTIFCNSNFTEQRPPLREVDRTRNLSFESYLIGAALERERIGVGEALNRLISLALVEYNFLYYVRPDREFLSPEKIDRVYRTIWRIRSGLAEKISLSSMARTEGVSKVYFTQLWKDLVSMPFMRFVSRERVLASEGDLLFGCRRLIDISADSGFSDLKYYYKNFSSWFGARPLEWKERWAAYAAQRVSYRVLPEPEADEALKSFRSSLMGGLGSRAQKAAGVDIDKYDVVEELCRYASHRADQRLIKLWADRSGEAIDRLEDVAKEYGATMVLETDTGLPMHGVYRTYPIQHNIQNAEKAIESTQILKDKAAKLGVSILLETPMVQLIREEGGSRRVVGAVAKTADGCVRFLARKGVILATGGYSSNLDMLAEENPVAVRSCCLSASHSGSKGDGIRAATWIGAAKDAVPTVMIFD